MRIAFRLPSTRASRALNSFVAPVLVASAALLVGCSDGNGTGDDAGSTGGTGGGTSNPNALKLTQANNFSATSVLTPAQVQAAAGQNISICWDKIMVDIQGHAVNPATDINQVTFVPAKGTPDQVAGWLNSGQLTNDRISGGGAYVFKPNGTSMCATLSQFTPVGNDNVTYNPSDFKVQDGISYLVVFNTGTQLGLGARTMLFLVPVAGDPTGMVSAEADSHARLMYTADLHDLVKPTFDATKPPTVDWTGVTKDGQGIEFSKSAVTRILVGLYKNKSVSDLEKGFLNLDQKTEAAGGPTQSWQLKIDGVQSANLGAAVGRNNEPALTSFPTAATDTWLLGMFCDGCQNPAPVIVTILDPK